MKLRKAWDIFQHTPLENWPCPWNKNMKLEDYSLWCRDGPVAFQGLCLLNIRGQQWQHCWGGQARESHCPTSTASTKTWLPQHPNHCEKSMESQEVFSKGPSTLPEKLTARISTKKIMVGKNVPYFFGMPSLQVRSVSFRGHMMWWSVMISFRGRSTVEGRRIANVLTHIFNALFEKSYNTYFMKLMSCTSANYTVYEMASMSTLCIIQK